MHICLISISCYIFVCLVTAVYYEVYLIFSHRTLSKGLSILDM